MTLMHCPCLYSSIHLQPPRHSPDIFEISPRPFAVSNTNNGFQFQRTANGFVNIPPPPPPPPPQVRRPVVDYLDTIGTIKRDPPQTLQQHNKNRQPAIQVSFRISLLFSRSFFLFFRKLRLIIRLLLSFHHAKPEAVVEAATATWP